MCKSLHTEQEAIPNPFSEQLRKTKVLIVRFVFQLLDFFFNLFNVIYLFIFLSFDLFPAISHGLLYVGTNTGHGTTAAIVGTEKSPIPYFVLFFYTSKVHSSLLATAWH